MRRNPISKIEVEKVEYIIEDIENGKLILNHTLQRYSGQWNSEQKGNLIRRILHDGQFLPILICTQYDENGCEVKYLIDGVQRISTIAEYLNDEFPIGKKTIDYMVSYEGILYDKKILSTGKFCLKKDKNGKLIPILDENGKKQRKVQEIDIRGLKYSELPPELQEKIKRYLVSVQLKIDCTDADIQLEILDYNSGTKMNDAQIGKNRLGAELAKYVVDLTEHPFIKNKCGFTPTNRIKGVIDRSINEALMLSFFGHENWIASHKDLCRSLGNMLTAEHIVEMGKMFDTLDETIPEDEQIKDYLTLKEFFIVIANYKHFLSLGYKNICYGKFIEEFIKTTSYFKDIPSGEINDDGEEILVSFREAYMTSGKQKGVVEERLAYMNELMEKFLEINCSDMKEDEITESDSEENTLILTEDLEEFSQNFVSDETAIKTLTLVTDGHPYASLETDALKSMITWFSENGTKQMLDDCLFYKSFVTENNIDENDKSLPFYTYGVKYIIANNVDIDVDAWIMSAKQLLFAENSGTELITNAQITEKQSEIINNITNF